MTRMFLFSCILTSGFLFQSLKNRPPEMVYETVSEISSEDSTKESPTTQKPQTEDLSPQNSLEDLSRSALAKVSQWIPESQEPVQGQYLISTSKETTMEATNFHFDSGQIVAELKSGSSVQLPLVDIQNLVVQESSSKDEDDLTYQLLLLHRFSPSKIDPTIFQRWLDTGGPKDLVQRFPHSDTHDLALRIHETTTIEIQTSQEPTFQMDINEMSEWMASVRDDVRNGISSTTRTQFILEIDQWQNWLENESGRRQISADKRSRFLSDLRLLKHDIVKGSGF